MSVRTVLGWIEIALAAAGLLLCVLLLWAVSSPLPYALRFAVERAGLTRVLRIKLALKVLRTLHWPSLAYMGAHSRLRPDGSKLAVRVVADERLSQLRITILQAQQAVVAACDKIAHLGSAGEAHLVADIDAMQREIEAAASLEKTVDPKILQDYESRSRSLASLVLGILLFVAFSLGNGIMLNQFSREMITSYFGPVPVSVVFSALLVVFEAGVGWLIAFFSDSWVKWLFVAMVGGFATVELAIFGLMSYNFDLQAQIFQDLPWTKYWLGLLGIVFAFTTAGVGYAVHRLYDELAASAGARELKRDLRRREAFVASLKPRWGAIRDNARQAKTALDAYGAALGARDGTSSADGVIKGLLAQANDTRDQMVQAIAAAHIEAWAQVVEGSDGDLRRADGRNFGILVATVLAFSAGVYVLPWVLSHAVARLFSGSTGIGASFLVMLAAYSTGFLAFDRLHNADTASGRVFPHRSGRIEQVFAIALALVLALGLIWAAIQGFGTAGAAIGFLLVAGMGGLAWFGYHFERACRALLSSLATVAALFAATVAAVLALLANLAVWLALAIFWPLWIMLYFLGLPTELAVEALRLRRSSRHGLAGEPLRSVT